MKKGLISDIMGNRKKRGILVAAVLAFLILPGASVYTVAIRPRLSAERFIYLETSVEYGDLVKGIQESGTVTLEESSINYELELKEDDDDEEDDEDDEDTVRYLVIEEVYAVPGQRINAGDKLFKLSENSIEKVRKKLNTREVQAKITLADAKSDYELNMLSAESTYRQSMAGNAAAGAIYNASLESIQSQVTAVKGQILLLNAEIAGLQEKLQDEDLYDAKTTAYYAMENARKAYEASDIHSVNAYASNLKEYENAKSTYEKACEAIDSKYESIADKLAEIEDLQRQQSELEAMIPSKQLEAKQTYDYSRASGDTADDILEYTRLSLEDSVSEAESDLDKITELLQDFESFVGDDGIISASEAGLVISVNYEEADELVTPGAMLSYVKEDTYSISIDVLEEDVPDISVGDAVDIVFTAYEDRSWKGNIASISTTASSGGSTVSYPVKINIEGDTSPLYGGMTADITFVTDYVENVLYVSRKAVEYDENNKSFVYVKNGSDYAVKQVETGFSDGVNIQILSGLRQGDTVYIKSRSTIDEKELKDTEMQGMPMQGTMQEPTQGPTQGMPMQGPMQRTN